MAVTYGLNGKYIVQLETPQEANAANRLIKRGGISPTNDEPRLEGCHQDSVLHFTTQEEAENALSLISRMT